MVLRSCSFTFRFYLLIVLSAVGYVCCWLCLLLAVQLLAFEISLILAHGQLFPTKIGVKIPPICGEILG
jgi:hypothetical protein